MLRRCRGIGIVRTDADKILKNKRLWKIPKFVDLAFLRNLELQILDFDQQNASREKLGPPIGVFFAPDPLWTPLLGLVIYELTMVGWILVVQNRPP